MTIFDEQTLRNEIIKTWGPAGAHIEVYDMLLDRIRDCEGAGRELLPLMAKAGITPPASFIALDSPKSWMDVRKDLAEHRKQNPLRDFTCWSAGNDTVYGFRIQASTGEEARVLVREKFPNERYYGAISNGAVELPEDCDEIHTWDGKQWKQTV